MASVTLTPCSYGTIRRTMWHKIFFPPPFPFRLTKWLPLNRTSFVQLCEWENRWAAPGKRILRPFFSYEIKHIRPITLLRAGEGPIIPVEWKSPPHDMHLWLLLSNWTCNEVHKYSFVSMLVCKIILVVFDVAIGLTCVDLLGAFSPIC